MSSWYLHRGRGSNGPKCQASESSPVASTSEETDDLSSVMIGASAGGAVALVLCLGLVAWYLKWRKERSQRGDAYSALLFHGWDGVHADSSSTCPDKDSIVNLLVLMEFAAVVL